MTAYRKPATKMVDLENDALDDLLALVRRLRRRVALPAMLVATAAGWVGGVAHGLGYWPLLGETADGRYFVSLGSVAIAAMLCGGPFLAVGAGIYLALRARLRRGWQTRHVGRGVSEEWLAENVARYG